ncbi:AbrB/MazE/SpoVT family DNA-binding domain-containing protein [haloarchaeon 3A1-DGR]|nr:AbrB/MazE/SpoVT family DNA-binding domain-containing protein [haloarchaeon 3A1-DGR]
MGKRVEVDADDGVVRAERTVRKSGNSIVVSIPTQVLEGAGLKEGDNVLLEADLDDGGIHLSKVEDTE